MGDVRRTRSVEPEVIYESVRQEILDQKRCQFQMFSAALTLTAALLAYASTLKESPLVYLAPVLMNVGALRIILSKAVSIQRMVGYLQIMESQKPPQHGWMWEYHLNLFRGLPGKIFRSESYRKHTYILTVALMLITLNAVATALYFWGPEAFALQRSPSFSRVGRVYGGIDVIVILLNVAGWFIARRTWVQLVHTTHTSEAIRERWNEAVQQAEENLKETGGAVGAATAGSRS